MPPRAVTNKDHQKYRSFITALFSEKDEERLRKHLDEIAVPDPYRVRLKVVYSKDPIDTALISLTKKANLKPLISEGLGYEFQPNKDSSDRESLLFVTLSTSKPNVTVLASISERLCWQRFLSALRQVYPRIVPVFLSQRELLAAVAGLRTRMGGQYELRLRELSARERLATDKRKHTRSIREWTDEQYEQALRHVEERRQLIGSMKLEFYRLVGDTTDFLQLAQCKATKTSEVELTSRFGLIWSTLIAYIADVGAKKLELFSHRGLKENNFVSAPLTIRYSEPIFDHVNEVRRFVQVLSQYPKSMHAVQHGNPYVFVQVADAYDGSAFDIWALSPQRITVVPKLKATEAAIGRLVHYIYEEFREGMVEGDGDREQ
jgi:hypothetical protein